MAKRSRLAQQKSRGREDRVRAEADEKARSYFDIQGEREVKAKKAVADRIVEKYFHPGDSILLDAGTSLHPIATRIVEMSKDRPDKTHFTIMTHNYKAFEILVEADKKANLNIVLAGGRYDQDLNALFGAQTASNYETFYPRTVVIGISGLVADIGLFCHGNTEELQVKELIFKKSCTRRIVVARHTKLGLPDSFLFGATLGLKAGAEDGCILVTTKPSSDSGRHVQDRYRNEVDALRNKYGIEVEEIELVNDA
jgi:DeoR family transcriptional regulator, fructose operon transcriptional repressor